MSERITVNSNKPVSIKENLISHKRKTDFRSNSSPVNRILYLQRTIGNQAVQRMVRSGTLQAKLKIGQPGDKYEQEADRVADAVMRMPEPRVQREVEPEEEEEEPIQAKPLVDLKIGQPGDNYEQEADRVAEQRIGTLRGGHENQDFRSMAMARQSPMQQTASANQTSVVQRQEANIPNEEEEEQQAGIVIFEDEAQPVQRQAEQSCGDAFLQLTGPKTNPQTPDFVEEDLSRQILRNRGQGQPLDSMIRTSLEAHFQQDFASVRLHRDSQASRFARKLNAQAFTMGEDIYFQQGYYNPTSRRGAYLLVHEIAHVRQQRQGVTLPATLHSIRTGKPGDVYEKEADQVAHEFLSARDQQAGEGPKIGENRPPIVESRQASLPISANMRLQRQEQSIQRQGGPAETAAAVAATAQAAVGAVRTLTYGNYKLTRPNHLDAIVTPKKPGCNPAKMPIRDWSWRFFAFREIHPIFRYEFVDIHLVATYQTNGCDVRAFHVVSPAGHRRSRLQTDTKAEIFSKVSARLVPSAWAPSCCDHAAVLRVPYEVTIDRPWPLSNLEENGRLDIEGTGSAQSSRRRVWT